MRTLIRAPLFLAAVLATLAAASGTASAQDAAAFFKASCASCHTIGGGRLVGPDLKGVTDRRERAWLERFIADPKAVIDGGDATARQLVQEARGVVMPTLAVAPDRIAALIDLIASESAKPRSEFAGPGGGGAEAPRLLTAADVDRGKRLFLGALPLANGGPPCTGCHQVRGLPALGGGRLGPDLTAVFARLGGQQALTAWLGAPASVTMKPVFARHALTPDEAHQLVAYFKTVGARGGVASSSMVTFVLFGLVGLVMGLVVIDMAWGRRFRAVRRPMVRGDR